jgi:hypothetical protein
MALPFEMTFGIDTELLLYVLVFYFICFILGLSWALFNSKDYIASNDRKIKNCELERVLPYQVLSQHLSGGINLKKRNLGLDNWPMS